MAKIASTRNLIEMSGSLVWKYCGICNNLFNDFKNLKIIQISSFSCGGIVKSKEKVHSQK